jgi:hypothetical protein
MDFWNIERNNQIWKLIKVETVLDRYSAQAFDARGLTTCGEPQSTWLCRLANGSPAHIRTQVGRTSAQRVHMVGTAPGPPAVARLEGARRRLSSEAVGDASTSAARWRRRARRRAQRLTKGPSRRRGQRCDHRGDVLQWRGCFGKWWRCC